MPQAAWCGVKATCENPGCEMRGVIREVDIFDNFDFPECAYCGEVLVRAEE